ncbi:alpha/beta hydrolase [Streptomyces sp. AN091965]|uniref:alpha/beta hydrolase n=1 Tax=Streptomyces sp. AN091965 TaxID=2927803 RepID=UPI001F61E896|nr:alpha/beta hydrolase [Streptomyces sp. AN091965]MCI3927946.1 alpha/beta hydrolase [Streptomyces sp. AN091965]
MPLHPQAAAFLDHLSQLRVPPLESVGVPAVRELMGGLRQVQGAAEPVGAITETRVPGPAGSLPVRVYHPSARPGPRPLMVFFHGGGWIAGDVELVDKPLRKLANACGAVVASVEYRRAPETQFPGPAEDAYAAIAALAERAEELGADPARLVVAGESAGGNLAAAACLMSRDRGGPAIAAQLLICPSLAPAADSPFVSYRRYATGYLNTRAAMAHFWDLYLASPQDAAHPYAAPLLAEEHTGLPPALILAAEYDPLRDEATAYGHYLRTSGVPGTVRRYDGALHVFFLMCESSAAAQARADITAWLHDRFPAPGMAPSRAS